MNTETVKKIIIEMLQKMNVAFDTVVIDESEKYDHPRFLIGTKDSKILIGHRGENLQALNHILRRMASKQFGEEVKFSVDVNGYQESSLRILRTKVLVMAERVKSFKASIELEPMPSYERMVVHSLFQDDPHIKTESQGLGKDRRIVIRYVETVNTTKEEF